MKLYQYAVIYLPKKDDEKEKAKVIVPVTTAIAPDDATANIIAARSIPESFIGKLDEVSVVVRPF